MDIWCLPLDMEIGVMETMRLGGEGWAHHQDSSCISSHPTKAPEMPDLLISAPSKTQDPNKVPSVSICVLPVINRIILIRFLGRLRLMDRMGKCCHQTTHGLGKRPNSRCCTNEVRAGSPFTFVTYQILTWWQTLPPCPCEASSSLSWFLLFEVWIHSFHSTV